MSPAPSTTVARAFRRTAVPLASYYAVTLGLPLANGAAQLGAAFVEHALVVFVVPPIVIVLACTAHRVARAFVRAAIVSRESRSSSADESRMPRLASWVIDEFGRAPGSKDQNRPLLRRVP